MPGNDANTKLLLHFDGTDGIKSAFCHMKMEDNSDDGSGANAVSDIGTPTYTSGKINNALTLDGSSDALNVNALQADIESDTIGSFVAWVKHDISATGTLFSLGDTAGTNSVFNIEITSSGKVACIIKDNGSTVMNNSTTNAVYTTNTYFHLAVVQDGSALKIYINGTSVDVTYSTGGSQWCTDANSAVIDNGRIGCQNRNGSGDIEWLKGQVDDFRYYKCVLSQTEVTAIYNGGSGTESLIAFPDSRKTGTAHEVTSYADAQLDTAIKKWGTASCKFDGTGDYLTIPNSSDFDIAASNVTDYTVDFWFRLNADSSYSFLYYQSATEGSDIWYWRCVIISTTDIRFTLKNASSTPVNFAANAGLSTDTWYHYAVIKVGTDWGLYIDGTQISYGSNSTTVSVSSGQLSIGRRVYGSDLYLNGYMDEVRIQNSNYFTAAPNVGTSNTITIPTKAYSGAFPYSQSIIVA